jgi:hypothetical protein
MLKYAYVPQCWNEQDHHQIHIWPDAFQRIIVFEEDHIGNMYPKLAKDVKKMVV